VPGLFPEGVWVTGLLEEVVRSSKWTLFSSSHQGRDGGGAVTCSDALLLLLLLFLALMHCCCCCCRFVCQPHAVCMCLFSQGRVVSGHSDALDVVAAAAGQLGALKVCGSRGGGSRCGKGGDHPLGELWGVESHSPCRHVYDGCFTSLPVCAALLPLSMAPHVDSREEPHTFASL